ncbi:MAG: hypothetical protein IJL73_01730 [Lachnospiraceae bacterium]|nr:hypothetical protein [Lachnospiraceae bacterium]
MEHWLIVLLVIIGVVAVIFLLALSSGSIVIWAANRFFRKQANELEKAVTAELPKTDCGECGCTSCVEYAKKWAAERKEPAPCPHLSEEKREKVLAFQNEQDTYLESRLATRPKDDPLRKRRNF